LQTTGVFILCAVLISLGIFVIFHDRRAEVNRLFGLFVFATVGWILSISISLSARDVHWTISLGRLAFAFASAMPFTLLWMFQAFSASRPTARQGGVIIPGIFCLAFILFSLSPWIVTGVRPGSHRPNFIYGPLHPFFAVYTVLCFGFALYTLWRKIRSASGIIKLQLRYLLLGVLIGGAGAITTNLLIPLVWKTSRYSVVGPYFALVLASFSAHAIIRYRLMDIKVVIRKGVVYFCAITVSAVVFFGLAAIVSSALGFDQETIPLSAAVAIGVVMAIFFQPLRNWIHDSLNRYLSRQTYDYQRTVREASRRLGTILDLQSLLSHLTDVIARTLRVEMIAVYLRDPLGSTFIPRVFQRAVEWRAETSGPVLSAASPLVAALEREKRTLVRDEATRDAGARSLVEAARQLQAIGGEIAFPFPQDHTISGFLVVGPKLSGDPYFAEDIDLLSTLAGQAGIALKNAQLYREVTLANEYIENIVTTMESGVIAVSGDRRITLVHTAAERMTGQSARDLRSGPVERLPAPLAAPLEATLADGQPRFQTEIILLDALGRLTPIACSTSALRDAAGDIHGTVAVFSDLSRLKELEEEKRRGERLAAFGALATGIAHEIKNPLVAIKTFAELLPERFTDPDFREGFSKVVVGEINRIDALIARLRGLAPPARTALSLTDAQVPLEETLALLGGQLAAKGITVRRVIPPAVPQVLADPAQLKQLFLNLFLNSLDAMGTGGTLTVRLAPSDRGAGQQVLVIQVGDTGGGIPPDALGKVFDPFFTTKARGTGLGLAICRGIVDAHKGTIRAENNREGPGATVTIELSVPARILAEALL
jgi:PAS domain S-box-containing protein